MPDMERLTRSLEKHAARTPEERAFVAGKHFGQDQARKQVLWISATLASIIVFFTVYLR